MGVVEESVATITPESTCASKKERQFQVVHVPGVFTRGRWQCWDYRDDHASTNNDKKIESAEKEGNNENVAPSVTSEMHSPSREESSTILVTSIAPAPPTPQHGTPGSQHDIQSPDYAATGDESRWQRSAVSPTGNSAQKHPSPEMGLSGSEAATVEEEPTTVATSSVAIDNKIEQAMDLVKTHLTFAVREEVDVLRATIAELEAKVALLESQNSQLRRYVPSEVLENLPVLVTAQKQSSSALQQPSSTQQAPPTQNSEVSSQPDSQHLPYCAATTNFANTLNTVVPSPQQ